MRHTILFCILLGAVQFLPAQAQIESSGASPFALQLDALEIAGLPGLQSYAWGRSGGQWLIVGGRLDGLHRRQPWASFDEAGQNTYAYVVDPVGQQVWSRSVTELPVSIAEQLMATNPCFEESGNTLYIVGGYGYSTVAADHITHPALTAIDLAEFMEAVRTGAALTPHIRQLQDEQFAVTGGHLDRIGEMWLITGGQRFDGLYNPMGHPTHVQTYTDATRRFRLYDNGAALSVTHLTAYSDATLFHRRDYNVIPQIFEDGHWGLTGFSGVFRPDVDQPFLNLVDLDTLGWAEREGFSQYLNHYHCPHAGLYSTSQSAMHNVFFGGIAQYTMDASGNLIQDTDVPFVNTIARISRQSDGTMGEYKLPKDMPGLLGAGAEFLPVSGLPEAGPGVLDLDALLTLAGTDSVLVGYIFGGIRSDAPNIFWTSEGELSQAEPRIFRVWLKLGSATGIDQLNVSSQDGLRLQVYPNPNDGKFRAAFDLVNDAPVHVKVFSADGSLLRDLEAQQMSAGTHEIALDLTPESTSLFILELQVGDKQAVQVVVSRP
jgi:hypothetical protein